MTAGLTCPPSGEEQSTGRCRRQPQVGHLDNAPPRPFRARGSFVTRCEACLLPASHCICRFRPCLETGADGEPAAEFWLLMHPDERYKPTNTGRLIADCLPGTRIFTWHRKEPPQGFLELCQSPDYAPMIVFPAPEDRYGDRLLERLPPSRLRPAFILLDGTWQQAGKMFRLTHYLQSLPVLRLNPDYHSGYRLRRSVHPGQLCTAEVAAELLKTVGAEDAASKMHSYLTVFSDHYSAARNNHPVREETEAMRILAPLG